MPRPKRPQPGVVTFERAASPQQAPHNISTYTHSPAERFIKYALSRDLHTNIPVLAQSLDAHGLMLPAQPEVYLRRLAAELDSRMPEPFRPLDPSHIQSQMFLHNAEILTLWQPDQSVVEAAALYKDLRTRDMLRALISSGQNRADILRAVEHIIHHPISSKSVESFIHIYWDLLLLSVDDREMLYCDYRLPDSVRNAGFNRNRAGRAHVMSQELEVKVVDGAHTWEDAFSLSYYNMAESQRIRDIQTRVYTQGEAIRSMRTAHEVLEDQRVNNEASGHLTASVFTVLHTPRETRTIGEIQTPGTQPKRLPGRVATLTVDGEKVEGKSNGSKTS